MIDSTNAEKEGHSLSEQIVIKNLEEIFKKANGRIIVTTFSSLLDRIAQIIKIAERLGRKVTFSGYSMRSNVLIAQKLGYIKTEPNTIIPLEDVNKYHDNKILILTTGAQGEPNASLMRIISYEHPIIKIKPGDTVVFSSSVIPGNERSVQNIKDNLARQGAIVYHSDLVDIHASGHATREDLKMVMKLIKPRFVVPLHGYYFMRHANAQNAIEVGIPKENAILMDNGQIAEIYPDKFIVTNQTVPSFYVMVDGLGVGDVEEVVLRDRRNLAQEGMIVLIVTIDKHTGKLLKSPDIISRGFIYLRENQPLLEEIRRRLRGMIARLTGQKEIDSDYLKTLIREQISQFLYNKTKRRPMVLPVVIEI
jgi:ribonuclease J